MHLAVITDEISQDLARAASVMLEYGVRAAELRGIWGVNVTEADESELARAREVINQNGLEVACIASPVFKCDIDSDAAVVEGPMHLASARSMPQQLELLRRCADLAHRFGTDLVRVFSFWRRGPLSPEIESRIVDAFAEPVRIAGMEGVTLLLENEHACYIGTGAETRRIVDAVGSPQLAVCWDPGNALCAGEEPYPDGYSAVRGAVRHVHIKDAKRHGENGDLKWCVVGEGDIDYVGHFSALRADGYSGYVSLETHYIPPNGTNEDGSRACLAALRQLIED